MINKLTFCIQVEIAFKCWDTSKYVPPEEDFDAKTGGDGTNGFGDTIIQHMVGDPQVREEFLIRARQHAPRGSESAKISCPARSRKRNIFASSSPSARG